MLSLQVLTGSRKQHSHLYYTKKAAIIRHIFLKQLHWIQLNWIYNEDHSNWECKVRKRRNLICEDLVFLLPLVFLLELSYGSFLPCIRYIAGTIKIVSNFLCQQCLLLFRILLTALNVLCEIWESSIVWKGKKFKLNMLLAVPGGSFSILDLIHLILFSQPGEQTLWVQGIMQLLCIQRCSKLSGLQENLWWDWLPCHTFFFCI